MPLTLALIALGILLGVALLLYINKVKQGSYGKLTGSDFYRGEDCSIGFTVKGQGKPIVLLHGIAANRCVWREITPLLAQNFKVIEVDLPGFGQSEVDGDNYDLDAQSKRLADFIRSVSREPVKVVGSSMGGAIACWLAKTEPKLIDSMVLISPATNSRRVPKALAGLKAVAPKLNSLLGRSLMKQFIRVVCTDWDKIDGNVVDLYLQPYKTNPKVTEAFFKSFELLSDHRLPASLTEIETPALILYGENDRVVRKTSMEELNQILSSSNLVCHMEGGHHLMEDEPEWVYHQSIGFLTGQQSKIL